MQKIENFENCLKILKGASIEKAKTDDIYRTGVIGQFNLTFELSWKSIQAVLRELGVSQADTGSPREILKLGFKFELINDEEVWLDMLKRRNTSTHIYNENEVDEFIKLIFEKYITAFDKLDITLHERLSRL